jgi:hypothetical protein
MIINPCKECKSKGCGAYHDKCEPYQEYREMQREKNEKKIKDQKLLDIHFDSIANAINLRKKQRGRF